MCATELAANSNDPSSKSDGAPRRPRDGLPTLLSRPRSFLGAHALHKGGLLVDSGGDDGQMRRAVMGTGADGVPILAIVTGAPARRPRWHNLLAKQASDSKPLPLRLVYRGSVGR